MFLAWSSSLVVVFLTIYIYPGTPCSRSKSALLPTQNARVYWLVHNPWVSTGAAYAKNVSPSTQAPHKQKQPMVLVEGRTPRPQLRRISAPSRPTDHLRCGGAETRSEACCSYRDAFHRHSWRNRPSRSIGIYLPHHILRLHHRLVMKS
jgi:hypothetical protein